MKANRISTYLFLGSVMIIALNSHGQCPSVGCTTTINGPDAGTYTLLTGQKLCLAAGADFTGTVNMNGGTLENCASALQTFTWNFLVGPQGTINNYGDLASNLTISTTDADIYNYGTITVNSANNFHVNGDCQIYNYGTVTASNNIKASDVAYIYNEGTMDSSNQFHMNGTSTIDNHGTINGVHFKNSHDMYNAGTMNLTGSYSAPGTGTTTFDGGCMSTPAWTNSKPLVGIACGTIDISGYSENQSSVTGTIAIVDATPPGAPPYVDTNTGSFGPGVQWTSCGCPGPAVPEICGNGIDDNSDGRIDEPYPGMIQDNLLLWLKADEGVKTGGVPSVDGGNVNTWVDQSPFRTNDATDVNLSPPIFRNNTADEINFNPVVEFDGVDDGLDYGGDYIFSTGSGSQDGMTFFCVVEADDALSSKSKQYIYDFGRYNDNGYGLIYGDDYYSMYTSTADGGAVGTNQVNTFGTAPTLINHVIDFGTNQTISFNGGAPSYTNAITLSALTAAEINENPTPAWLDGPFTIGHQSKQELLGNENGRMYDGRLAELIGYSRVLSADEKKQVNSYLAIKYGLTLSHDYLDSQGNLIKDLSDGFNEGIASIGRDDNSGLMQLKSQGLESLFSIELLDKKSIENTSFLTWGSASSNSLKSDFLEIKKINLSSKIWKIEESGKMGMVKIQLFDANFKYILLSSYVDFRDFEVIEIDPESALYVDFQGVKYFTFSNKIVPYFAISSL